MRQLRRIIFFYVLPVVLIGILVVIFTGRPGAVSASEPAFSNVHQVELDEDLFIYDHPNPYAECIEELAGPAQRLTIHNTQALKDVLNDSNYVHLNDAQEIGIQPITDAASCWHLSQPIVKVESCSDFFLDSLSHSVPYLVPRASERLHEIGERFRDSLATRGGGDYRIRVTSVTRTPMSVAQLRRTNNNASENSAHCYATTFDISYARFAADSERMPNAPEDLKSILAEVIIAMRDEGKLWVKYEQKQPCFHITAR